MTAGALLGLFALDSLLLVGGLGLLYGLGLVRSPAEVARFLALALLAGWAAVGVAESWALVLGAPIRWWVTALLSAALGGAGIALGRRVARRRLRLLREKGLYRWAAAAGAAIVAVDLGAVLARVAVQGAPLQWDAWAFWLPKARAIADFGGLDTHVGGFTSFPSPGYPPLAPALDATVFAFTGNDAAAPLALQGWVIATAFFVALWSLLSVRVRPAVLWPCLALLASLPNVVAMIGSSLGDEPLMYLLGAAAACAALWLLEDEGRLGGLAALFLAAAALTKNEGIPPALVLGAALAATRWRRGVVLLAPLVAYAPWRIWIAAHRLPPSYDYRISDLLHPKLLVDRLHRLSFAVHALPSHLFAREEWLIALPLLLVAVILAAPIRPALAGLALAGVGAVVAELLVVYWIGLRPVRWYLQTSADRVIAPAMVMATVFLPLLLHEALTAHTRLPAPGGRARRSTAPLRR